MCPGLAGDTAIENAELFALVECVEEVWLKISSFFWENDESRKVRAGCLEVNSFPDHLHVTIIIIGSDIHSI